ncbi:MAG: hypothetical protein ABI233_06210 [Chthoniobacterales bacterium]
MQPESPDESDADISGSTMPLEHDQLEQVARGSETTCPCSIFGFSCTAFVTI